MLTMRPDKNSYYLNIADAVLERSTCLRRKYGAVIVKDDEIIATGYNGAPRGSENCCDIGYCEREGQSSFPDKVYQRDITREDYHHDRYIRIQKIPVQ